MKTRLVALGGFAALMVACGATLVAKTVSEAFTQYPGDHTIVTNATPTATPAITTDVPLSANDSLAVISNPGTFTVNGSSVSAQVAAYINPFSTAAIPPVVTQGGKLQGVKPQAVCVGAASATAKIASTQVGFVLHMTQTARDAFKTALSGVCTVNSSQTGCNESAGTRAVLYTQAGTSVPVSSGLIALRANHLNSVNSTSSAGFQSVYQVKFTPVTSGTATVNSGDEIYLMDLNSAYQIANPQCLPANP